MYNYTFWSKIIIELLKLSQEYVTVIGVYAPVEGDDEGNDKLHHDLQKIIITIKLLWLYQCENLMPELAMQKLNYRGKCGE